MARAWLATWVAWGNDRGGEPTFRVGPSLIVPARLLGATPYGPALQGSPLRWLAARTLRATPFDRKRTGDMGGRGSGVRLRARVVCLVAGATRLRLVLLRFFHDVPCACGGVSTSSLSLVARRGGGAVGPTSTPTKGVVTRWRRLPGFFPQGRDNGYPLCPPRLASAAQGPHGRRSPGLVRQRSLSRAALSSQPWPGRFSSCPALSGWPGSIERQGGHRLGLFGCLGPG